MKKIYSKKYVFLCILMATWIVTFAQTGWIRGKVLDENNGPLPGASVKIAGTTIGATTDINGDFVIPHLKPGPYVIVVNYIGYIAQTKPAIIAGEVVVVNFSLQVQNTNLDEVVVIGYGSQRKKDLTGSVVAISSKDFNEGPITSPEDLITGKVSGVLITSNGGEPGSGSTIRIRGGASLNASNDPLIIIDDVPVSNTPISGVADPLSMINPNDIESITILKDASSTAIYGSRASNGVVIVTTKKGDADGKLKTNYNSINSISDVTKQYPVLNASQFRSLVGEQDPEQLGLLGHTSTNWQSEIFQTAPATDNNISFTGGVKGLPYRLSIGYLDQDGTLRTDNLQRTSIDLNVGHDFFNKSLKAALNLKGTYSDSQFANQGAIGEAINYDPTKPVYSGSGKYGGYYEWLDASGNPLPTGPYNPVGLLYEQDSRGTAKRGIGSLNLNYMFPFIKGLQANATFGGDISDGQGHSLIPATAASNFFQHGFYAAYFNQNYTYNTDYYLKFQRELTSIRGHFDVQAGYSYQYFRFYNKGEQTYEADEVTPLANPTNNYNGQYYIESPFGRLNFDVDNKYLLTATIRDDRSSRFGPANRNGYFPSAAFAWRLKEESFLKHFDLLSDLKLRVSYGLTGQQDIGSGSNIFYFPYLEVYEPSDNGAGYQFGNTFTNTLRADPYNTNLKWETTATTDIGFDYGFLDGRVNGSIDYYYKKTHDLLVDTPVPDGTNLSNDVYENIGDLVTKGVDFNVSAITINAKNIKWTVAYNISYNARRITNISLTKDPNLIVPTGYINSLGNSIQIYKAGYAPNAFYVYQQVYGQNGQPLEGVYVDRNGNGTSNDDWYIYEQPNPAVFMGFSSNLTYKNWNFAFTLRSDLGNYVYNDIASGVALSGIEGPNYLNNLPTSILKTNFQNAQLYSDYFIENGSFLRMDNISLGYNFGKTDAGILKVSFNLQNVFIITKYTGLDPEVQGGIDNNLYARPRVYSLGLNTSF